MKTIEKNKHAQELAKKSWEVRKSKYTKEFLQEMQKKSVKKRLQNKRINKKNLTKKISTGSDINTLASVC